MNSKNLMMMMMIIHYLVTETQQPINDEEATVTRFYGVDELTELTRFK